MIEDLFTSLAKYIFIILFFAGWAGIPVFLYYSYQNKRKRQWLESQEYRLIKISVPKENEKGPLAAEQMFASLHGIFKPQKEQKEEGSMQEHISFEIASSSERISFYVWLPVHLRDFIEGQIYAQYSKAEFEEVTDYAARDFSGYHIVGTEIVLNKNEVLPIKTFINFEEVDPLSGITSVLSKIDEPNEDIWIQILIKPVDDSWQEKGLAYVKAMREGRSPESQSFGAIFKKGMLGFTKELFNAAVTTPEQKPKAPEPVRLTSSDEAKVKAIEEKVAKLGFSIKVRVGYITKKADLQAAKIKLKSVVGAFKQFNTTNLNGFQAGSMVIGEQFINDYKSRLFLDQGYVLNIEELASIFHLPNVSVETPSIGWTGSKKGEPPENLPIIIDTEENKNLSVFAATNFRHRKQKFGIKTDDRRRHMYLIGKTGTGKTNMMENMVISDIKAGHGVGVVDPHGDFVETVLKYIPKERVSDVILFDPADSEYPIAFNPLEVINEEQKTLVTSGLISIFQKIWADSWGPRLEYILRNTIISILDYPDSTMMGILKILVDSDYRKKVINKITDPVILDFWNKEFAQYNEKTKVDAILPIQNKVGQFLSSPTIRNIVGQPKSKIDMRYIMDNKKILLLKLSQGQIGEDNSSLLGAMMITKMQLAAMSRTDVTEDKRVDFYLYVDEFQNFATESFAKILSEARKYHLNLTLTNQYIAQLQDAGKSEAVKHAIFGNVGSLVCFRVGANDAKELAKELEPVFEENDLVNLDKYHIYVKLSIDGITGNAFSAKTLKIPDETEKNAESIIRNSRERYATKKEVVEEKITKWSEEVGEQPATITEEGEEGQRESKIGLDYSQYLESLKEEIEKGKEEKVSEADDSREEEKTKIQSPQEELPKEKVSQTKAQRIKELTSKIISNKNESGEGKAGEKLEQETKEKAHTHHIHHIKSRIESLRQKNKSHQHSEEASQGGGHKEIKPGEVVEFK